jgi:hypothetical protein
MKLKHIFVILVVMVFVSTFIFSCSKSDSSPTAPKQKEVIEIGDTINKVIEVYGDDYMSMNYYYESNGRAISGYMLIYSDPDITFYFDDSSPRKVIRIVGNQGG